MGLGSQSEKAGGAPALKCLYGEEAPNALLSALRKRHEGQVDDLRGGRSGRSFLSLYEVLQCCGSRVYEASVM